MVIKWFKGNTGRNGQALTAYRRTHPESLETVLHWLHRDYNIPISFLSALICQLFYIFLSFFLIMFDVLSTQRGNQAFLVHQQFQPFFHWPYADICFIQKSAVHSFPVHDRYGKPGNPAHRYIIPSISHTYTFLAVKLPPVQNFQKFLCQFF